MVYSIVSRILILLLAAAYLLGCGSSNPSYRVENGRVELYPVGSDTLVLTNGAAAYFIDLLDAMKVDDPEAIWFTVSTNSDEWLALADSIAEVEQGGNDWSLWKYEIKASINASAMRGYEEVIPEGDSVLSDTVYVDPDDPIKWDAWFVIDPDLKRVVSCSTYSGNEPFYELPKCEH